MFEIFSQSIPIQSQVLSLSHHSKSQVSLRPLMHQSMHHVVTQRLSLLASTSAIAIQRSATPPTIMCLLALMLYHMTDLKRNSIEISIRKASDETSTIALR